jgi:hypothetical protein
MPVTFYQSAWRNSPKVLNPIKLFYIIYKVSSSTSKRTHLTSLERPIGDHTKNKRPLLWQSLQVHKHAVCTKCRVFSVQTGRTCNDRYALKDKGKKVSSEVLNVVTTVNIVLWRVAYYSLLAKHQRFQETYGLHLTQKMKVADSTKHNTFQCLHQLPAYFYSL